MDIRTYHVYIMSSLSRTLYTGITNNLERRVFEHKRAQPGSFTARYNVNQLVYFEEFGDINQAITREKEVKRMTRRRKIELIDSVNPDWRDLSLAWEDPGFLVYLDRVSKIRYGLGALARGFLGLTRPCASRMRRARFPGAKPGRSTEPQRRELGLNCKAGSQLRSR